MNRFCKCSLCETVKNEKRVCSEFDRSDPIKMKSGSLHFPTFRMRKTFHCMLSAYLQAETKGASCIMKYCIHAQKSFRDRGVFVKKRWLTLVLELVMEISLLPMGGGTGVSEMRQQTRKSSDSLGFIPSM